MKNPITNKEGEGFVIQTYEDAQQVYAMDKLDALKMKPILECPNPFMRIKTAINSKEYTQLCHIVLELETYMLEQKKLPTDFDQVAPNLKAALDPGMVFAQDFHRVPGPPATFQDPYAGIHQPAGPADVDMVMNGYDIVKRLEKLEKRQAKAIRDVNVAIQN